MAPSPPQPFRPPGDRDSPYVAELRRLFFAALEELHPAASAKLVEYAAAPFVELAERMEERYGEEFWDLDSELLETLRESADEVDATPNASGEEREEDGKATPSVELEFGSTEVEHFEKETAEGETVDLPLLTEEQKRELIQDLEEGDPRESLLALALHTELYRWARAYNLHRDEWVLSYGLRVLQTWRSSPGADRGSPAGSLGTHIPVLLNGSPSGFTPRRYRPERETRDEYLAWIDRYMTRNEEILKGRGWEPGKWKPHAPVHLDWLARYQVGESVDSIRASARVGNKRTVERALQEMAELIGLTRRGLADGP